MVTEVAAISVTVDDIKYTDFFACCSGTISIWKNRIIRKTGIVYLSIYMGMLQMWSSGSLL